MKKFLPLLILLTIFTFFLVKEAKAGTADNVSGWAWSENIGWLSFNCTNQGTCATTDYGVNIDDLGNFSGQAWSENIGWIDFAPSGPYPALPDYSARLDLKTWEVSGWARVISYGDGWSGWIKLRDANYGVSIDQTTGEFSGWAWSDLIIGWISFNCAQGGYDEATGGDYSVCGVSDYKVIATLANLPPIGEVNVPEIGLVNQWIEINVSGSFDPEGEMVSVNFSSNLVGQPPGVWDPYGPYDWNISYPDSPTGAWDAVKKTKKWSFSSPGSYEVWVELKDKAGQVTQYFDTITITECTPGETKTCTSTYGCQHLITCTSEGIWPVCGPTDECSPGSTQDCGLQGTQTCLDSCSWGSCLEPSPECPWPPDLTCPICQHPECIAPNWVCQPDPLGTDCGDCQECDGAGNCLFQCLGDQSSCQCISDLCIDCSNYYDPGGPTYGYQGVCNCGPLEIPVWSCLDGKCSCLCWNPSLPPPEPPYSPPSPPPSSPPLPPSCQRDYPEVILSPFTQSGTAGQELSYQVSVINNDLNCDSSTFSLTAKEICDEVGWTCSSLADLTILAGQSDSTILTVRSPFNISRGNYDLSVTAQNTGQGLEIYFGTGYAIYQVLNNPPQAKNLSVAAPNPVDYCGVTGYPPVRVRWEFFDQDDNDYQTAYQIEVFEGGIKIVDTGKKTGDTQEYVFQLPGEQLSWAKTYSWKVMVWDMEDIPSNWTGGPQFNTPFHIFPEPDFSWTPQYPSVDEVVQFCSVYEEVIIPCEEPPCPVEVICPERKDCYSINNNPISCLGGMFLWTMPGIEGLDYQFVDGTNPNSENPRVKFLTTAGGNVKLEITDKDGYGPCPVTNYIGVTLPLPEWKEIPPFIWLKNFLANILGSLRTLFS